MEIKDKKEKKKRDSSHGLERSEKRDNGKDMEREKMV